MLDLLARSPLLRKWAPVAAMDIYMHEIPQADIELNVQMFLIYCTVFTPGIS